MPITYTIMLLLSMLTPQQQKTSTELIYIGDPMCSWCYGISEEMKTVKDHFEGQLEFKMVMGGLRPYNTQSMSQLKDFLTHHWEEVSALSGQEFKYSILDDTSITYDTEPPCRASVVVRDLDASKEFLFFKAVQKAFYHENKNMHLTETYHPLLETLNLDIAAFDKAFVSEEYKEKVREDFVYAKTLGINSFPTLLIKQTDNKKEEKLHIVARGYAKSGEMIKIIEQIINE